MNEKILTLHPSKKGEFILARRFHLIRNAILTVLEEEGPCTYTYLESRIGDRIPYLFDGKVKRYIRIIKHDLQARRTIESIPGSLLLQLKIRESS